MEGTQNIFDGLSNARKLQYIATKAIPKLKQMMTEVEKLLVINESLLAICQTRYQSSNGIIGKRHYVEQAFRISTTVYTEIHVMLTGELKHPHHLQSMQAFIHNRAKDKYKYRGNVFTLASCDGIRYELNDLSGRVDEGTDFAGAIDVQKDISDQISSKYEKLVDILIACLEEFVRSVSTTQINKDDFVNKGRFVAKLKCGGNVSEAGRKYTYIASEIVLYSLQDVRNSIIEDCDDATVHGHKKSTRSMVVVDEESPPQDFAVEETVSINAIKEGCGVDPKEMQKHERAFQNEGKYENPQDAHRDKRSREVVVEEVVMEVQAAPTPDESYELVVDMHIKYSELSADSCSLLDRTLKHKLKFSLASNVPATSNELIAEVFTQLWSSFPTMVLIPRSVAADKVELGEEAIIDLYAALKLEVDCRSSDLSFIRVVSQMRRAASEVAPLPLGFFQQVETACFATYEHGKPFHLKVKAMGYQLLGHGQALSHFLEALRGVITAPLHAEFRLMLDGDILAALVASCHAVDVSGCSLFSHDFDKAAAVLSSTISASPLAYLCLWGNKPFLSRGAVGNKDPEGKGFVKFVNVVIGRGPRLESIDFSACAGESIIDDHAVLLSSVSGSCRLRSDNELPPLSKVTCTGLFHELFSKENAVVFQSNLPVGTDFVTDDDATQYMLSTFADM